MARELHAGKVLVYPTETFLALGCDATSPAACARVLALKGRPPSMGLPCIAADLEMIRACVVDPPLSIAILARTFWPGPLTLVLDARPGAGLAPEVCVAGTVALRVSGDATARKLSEAAGVPLVATSANQWREPPATSFDGLAGHLVDGVDVVVTGRPCPGGAPTTIVDLTGPEPRLVRSGAVAFERVVACLGQGPAAERVGGIR